MTVKTACAIEVRCILVVDDEPDCRDVVALLLEGEGHTVMTAADGEQALASMAEAPVPRLVVLDLMMPRLSGSDVLRAMRADPRLCKVPVVLVSAAPASACESLQNDPLVTYVPKPLCVDTFLERVTGALDLGGPGTYARTG